MRGGWGVRGCRASGADREADEHEFGPWHAAWACPGGPRSAPTPLGLDSAPMKGAIALVGSGEFTSALEAIDRELLAATGRARPRVAILPTASASAGGDVLLRRAEVGPPHRAARPETLMLLLILAAPRGSVVLGIDEETAAVGRDGTWQVQGRGRVTVWRGRRRTPHRDGETFRL